VTTGQIAAGSVARAHRRVSAETIAGVGGFTFLILVIFQNILRAMTSPANDASPAQILQFAHDQAWTVDLLVVTYIIGFPALLLFSSGVARLIGQENPRAGVWAQMGQASVIVIAVFFAFVNLLDVLLVASRGDLAGDPTLTSVIWSLHNAVFTINLLAVAGALLGLGWGAALSGLISRRFGLVCVAGAVLLGVAAAPIVAEVHGSPVLGIGLLGYITWLVFLAVASSKLVRLGNR
jgi:hypothetical protein